MEARQEEKKKVTFRIPPRAHRNIKAMAAQDGLDMGDWLDKMQATEAQKRGLWPVEEAQHGG